MNKDHLKFKYPVDNRTDEMIIDSVMEQFAINWVHENVTKKTYEDISQEAKSSIRLNVKASVEYALQSKTFPASLHNFESDEKEIDNAEVVYSLLASFGEGVLLQTALDTNYFKEFSLDPVKSKQSIKILRSALDSEYSVLAVVNGPEIPGVPRVIYTLLVLSQINGKLIVQLNAVGHSKNTDPAIDISTITPPSNPIKIEDSPKKILRPKDQGLH